MERKIKNISVYFDADKLYSELKLFTVEEIEGALEGTVTPLDSLPRLKREAEFWIRDFGIKPDWSFNTLFFRKDGLLKKSARRDVFRSGICLGATHDFGRYEFVEYCLELQGSDENYELVWDLKKIQVTHKEYEDKLIKIGVDVY